MPDPILRNLVTATNAADPETSEAQQITLFTTGGVIAGRLISLSRWAREALSAESPNSAFSDLLETRRLAEAAEAKPPQEWTPEEARAWQDVESGPEHIHLAEARWVSPAGFMPTNEGMHWRGRLEHVSGWLVGTLGPAPAPGA